MCTRAASCFLVHTFSHTFLLAQFPLVLGNISVVLFSPCSSSSLFSLYKENSFHILSSSLLPPAAPGIPSGQPCAHSERVYGVLASRGGG